MSARYSTSPALRLLITDSKRYRYCQCGFHLALMIALLLLARGGHPVCAALLPLIPLSCYLHRRQPQTGLTLCWQQGRWTLWVRGEECAIEVQRGRCLPWVTFVQWRRDSGGLGSAWLFADSCQPEQLRRLRVRLRLERRV